MFCTKCGEQVSGDGSFCHKCGSKIVQADTDINQEPVTTEPSLATPRCEKCGEYIDPSKAWCKKCGHKSIKTIPVDPTKKPSFGGSTTAIVLGFIYLAGSKTLKSSGISPAFGLSLILGGFAFKSLKKRKLGIVKNSTLRVVSESIAMALILACVLLTPGAANNIEINFLANFFAPLMVIFYYVWLLRKKPHEVK